MKNYFYWKSNKQLWRESEKYLDNSQDLFVEEIEKSFIKNIKLFKKK